MVRLCIFLAVRNVTGAIQNQGRYKCRFAFDCPVNFWFETWPPQHEPFARSTWKLEVKIFKMQLKILFFRLPGWSTVRYAYKFRSQGAPLAMLLARLQARALGFKGFRLAEGGSAAGPGMAFLGRGLHCISANKRAHAQYLGSNFDRSCGKLAACSSRTPRMQLCQTKPSIDQTSAKYYN